MADFDLLNTVWRSAIFTALTQKLTVMTKNKTFRAWPPSTELGGWWLQD